MNEIEWAEPLPPNCPPAEAISPAGGIYYRFVNGIPAAEADFQSHRLRFPRKHFDVSECVARSLSVYDDLNHAKIVLKLRATNTKRIVGIALPQGSGLIQKTFGPHHWSWWRAKGFNPLNQALEAQL